MNTKMHNVLVLGAGRVARPCVQYLLRGGDIEVTLVDQSPDNLEFVLQGHPQGYGIVGNAVTSLENIVAERNPEVVINLLPNKYNFLITEKCVKLRRNIVNPSYIDSQIQALDAEAKEVGIIILCEMGLDPGIDHMSAKSTIDKIHSQDGLLESFSSWCGALPAPEASLNPMGYKITWSPDGLVGACTREARFLRDGQKVVIPGEEIFLHNTLMNIDGLGWFEEYPNGNFLPYAELYGIPEVKNLYRATLRYLGWSETINAMVKLGLFDKTIRSFKDMTFAGLLQELMKLRPGVGLLEGLKGKLAIAPHLAIVKRLEWLGLLSDEQIPLEQGSTADLIVDLFVRKLNLQPGERDLVVMEHQYIASFPEGKKTKIISTLIKYGSPHGDTAIALTTGLPLAMGAEGIIRGTISLKGVQGPVVSEIYETVLSKLEKEDIRFTEKQVEILE